MALVNFLKGFYSTLIRIGNALQPLFLLATRLIWGLLFYFTGAKKLDDINVVTGFFQNLNIPFPEFSAYLVGWTEMVCGICLVLGFASRLVSIPLAIIMLVAFLTAHFEEVRKITTNFAPILQASPFTYIYALLAIFVFGPGKISIDYLLEQLIGSGRGK